VKDQLKSVEKVTGVKGEFVRVTSKGHYLYKFGDIRLAMSCSPSHGKGTRNKIADIKKHFGGVRC
jgi:hypothetical protein